MCTGFGCNACAVVGSRIIDSKRDRLIAILTNSFIPCNGRFPLLIAVISMFLSNNIIITSIYLCIFIIIAIVVSFLSSFILSKTLLKGYPGFFVLELPSYKKVKLKSIFKKAIIYKSLSILKKAIIVSIPCGIVLYIMSHIMINGSSLFMILSNYLDSIAKIIGLDGVILLAFFLALPANEIVLPIIIMGYLGLSNVSLIGDYLSIKNIFVSNGWTASTAISVIIFSIMHFPCGTTLSTIRSEVGTKWMIYSFIIPLVFGIFILFIFNLIA
jgi:ferrous iron transport protein B